MDRLKLRTDKIFKNPPNLRSSGWDLDIFDNRSKIIRGELRRIVEKEYKILDLYRDGTVIFALSAEGESLAWGRDHNNLRINSLALIETTYNFVSFYHLVINNLEPKLSEVLIRVDLHNMHLNGEKTFMLPYSLGPFSRQPHPSPNEAWDKTLKFEVSNFDVGIVAYQIVQEIYLWFGMDSDMIPYTSNKNSYKKIDSGQIRNVK